MNLLKVTLLVTCLFSITGFSAVAEKVESFDLNQDGLKDRYEYSRAGKIVRIEEDRSGDKKIDFKTFLDDKTYYKIQWQYSDTTGKVERKTSHLLVSKTKSKLITEVDKDGDGVFEVKYDQVVENSQKQDHCGEVNSTIRDLSNTTLKAISKTDKGMLPTGLGYKVDFECYNKWGDDFNNIVKEVAVGGLQCLMDLDKNGKTGTKITGALRNAFDLTKLMKNDGISLVCSEKKYDWTGTAAHASATSSEVLAEKNIKHPFLSINPNYPEQPIGNRQDEIAGLKETIFHETLHNLGYLHEEDIEFSYTCGLCCFDKKSEDNVKAQACKVCTGNYKNATDLNYIKDFVEFSQHNFQAERGAAATIKYLKENPKNTEAVSILAYSASGVFNPVGGELAKLVVAKHTNLTINDHIYIANAAKYDDLEEFKTIKTSSQALSSSLYELYFNKSSANTLAVLEKNKVAIKEELAKLQKSGDNNSYIHDKMKNVLDDVIHDMWLNKYPDGETATGKAHSDRAYELYDYFK